MDVYSIIFIAIAICCLLAGVVCLFKCHNNNKLCTAGYVLLIVFLYSAVSAFCFANINRCTECKSVVRTAFCSQCGLQNENYMEPVQENHSGLMCPVCKIERHTPYCGDCGSEIIFVENN